MTTYKLTHETGWQTIPGDTKLIVAHFEDGHTEKMEVWKFLTIGRKIDKIQKIDCYSAGEKIKED